jgi:hypothetical protein
LLKHQRTRSLSGRIANGADNGVGAPIVIDLSDGWPSVGEWGRAKIVSDLWKLNHEGKAQIVSLGFANADLELLNAIAIMNGDVSGSIVQSNNIDYSIKIEDFFQSEFGIVLLTDVNVKFVSGGDAVVWG